MSAIVVQKFDGVNLARIDEEARIQDLHLARWLEYEKPADIRGLIARNAEFLGRQGPLPHRAEKSSGGRPGRAYWLNKKQALFIASKSEKPKGSEILLLLIEAFESADRDAVEQEAAKSWIFRKVFLELPVHTEALWVPEILGPIAGLYGVDYSGGRAPVETKRIQREIYDLVIGSELIQQLREQHPDPPGENGTPYIYDHFHPAVRKAVEVELGKVAALAETSGSRDDFRAKLRAKYGTSMLQLVLGGKAVNRWLLPPKSEPPKGKRKPRKPRDEK